MNRSVPNRRPVTIRSPSTGTNPTARDVPAVLDQYTRMSTVAASCESLAKAALFLARAGQGVEGPVLSTAETRRVNALMLTCGLYDAAGDFAYRGPARQERCR